MTVSWLIAHMKKISAILSEICIHKVLTLQCHIEKNRRRIPEMKEVTVLCNPDLTRINLVHAICGAMN